MVKILSKVANTINNTYEVELFVDAKSDLAGLDLGYDLEMGSSAITANGEIAFLKSDGTWNWIGSN